MKYIEKLLSNDKYKNDLDTLCALEANRVFCKHDKTHFKNVSLIARVLNQENSLKISEDVIDLCAYLHDMGRLAEYSGVENHHKASYNYALDIMNEIEVPKDMQNQVLLGISHGVKRFDVTERYDNRHKLLTLNEIISFADHFSRNCYDCKESEGCKWSAKEKIDRNYYGLED